MSFNVSPRLPKVRNFGFTEESQVEYALNYNGWKTTLLGLVLSILWCFSLGFVDFIFAKPIASNAFEIIQRPIAEYISHFLSSTLAFLIITLPVTLWSLYSYLKNKFARTKGVRYRRNVSRANDQASELKRQLLNALGQARLKEEDISEQSDKLKRMLIPRAKSHFDNNAHTKFWDAIEEIDTLLFISQQSLNELIGYVALYFKTLNGNQHNFPLLDLTDTKSRLLSICECAQSIHYVVDSALTNDEFNSALKQHRTWSGLETPAQITQDKIKDINNLINNLSGVIEGNSKMSQQQSEACKVTFCSISNILTMSVNNK